MQPFGKPVVPEVYWMLIRSSRAGRHWRLERVVRPVEQRVPAPLVPRAAPTTTIRAAENCRHAPWSSRRAWQAVIVDEQPRHLGVLDHVLHLARRVGDVHRHHHGAERASASHVAGIAATFGIITPTCVRLGDAGPRHAAREPVYLAAQRGIGDGLAALEEIPGDAARAPRPRRCVQQRGDVGRQRLGLDLPPALRQRRDLQAEHVA